MPKTKVAKKYDLIYCDPPWKYSNTKGQGTIGSTFNSTYPTMSKESLIDMQVRKKYAGPDCVLLMWATGPQMHVALQVMEGWGFRYRTTFLTWIKIAEAGQVLKGVGNYSRSNAEFLLLGTCGKVGKFRTSQRKFTSSVLHARRREHSRKPAEARTRILQVFDPNLKKIELFARETPRGWDVMGNETNKFSSYGARASEQEPKAVTTGERRIESYFQNSS